MEYWNNSIYFNSNSVVKSCKIIMAGYIKELSS